MTMSDEDIDRLADAIAERQAITAFEDNPPADLVYEPEINGYRSPSRGTYYLKAGNGRIREITREEHDLMKGY